MHIRKLLRGGGDTNEDPNPSNTPVAREQHQDESEGGLVINQEPNPSDTPVTRKLNQDESGGGLVNRELLLSGGDSDLGVVVDVTKPVTPTRPIPRKLLFGENMTPEVASQKATPNSTPGKRQLEGMVHSPPLKRPKKISVIERLMSNRPRSFSTPVKRQPRSRKLSTPTIGSQRKITDMLGTQALEDDALQLPRIVPVDNTVVVGRNEQEGLVPTNHDEGI